MQDRVKGPATALIVVAALGILMALANLALQGSMLEIYRKVGMPEDQVHQMEEMSKGGWMLTAVLTVVHFVGAGFVIYGALQMMKLRNWTIAMIASFLVMIPCFTSCCCLIGIPAGIWSLVVLFKPDVKAAFANTPAPL
jgi:hypothetical protein